jgi:2-iminobutanoate/2-iminopropanoate deaminase
VRAGSTLYISGIASNKPTLEKQVEEIYSTIQRILKDYRLDTSSIVKLVIYTTDIEAYKSLGAAGGKKYFKENAYPSSTLVQIEKLYSKEHIVEIEVVAYIETR